MPNFGPHSLAVLQDAHPDLVRVLTEVIRHADCTVLNSIRSVERQREFVRKGLSKTMASKHLPGPDGKARACDVAPYPQRWSETTGAKMTTWEVDQVYFGGFVMGVAAALGVPLRYGGDWNRDAAQIGAGFRDLDHFELGD